MFHKILENFTKLYETLQDLKKVHNFTKHLQDFTQLFKTLQTLTTNTKLDKTSKSLYKILTTSTQLYKTLRNIVQTIQNLTIPYKTYKTGTKKNLTTLYKLNVQKNLHNF